MTRISRWLHAMATLRDVFWCNECGAQYETYGEAMDCAANDWRNR